MLVIEQRPERRIQIDLGDGWFGFVYSIKERGKIKIYLEFPKEIKIVCVSQIQPTDDHASIIRKREVEKGEKKTALAGMNWKGGVR
jgi:hypothetical protein